MESLDHDATLAENPYAPPAEGGASHMLPTDSGGLVFSAPSLFGLCAAIAAVAWVSVSTGVPTIYSPFPLLVVLPTFFGLPQAAVSILAAGIFALSHIRHFKRKPRPKPSVGLTVLLAVITGLSLIWIFAGWSYGLQYQGIAYTVGVAIANLVFAATAWTAWWASRTPGRLRMQAVFGFTLFAWMCWFALPWMGELP